MCFWILPSSPKSREIEIFKISLILHLVKLWAESLGTVCLQERVGHNLWLNYQFSRNRNVHIDITILCQFKSKKKLQNVSRVGSTPRPPTVFGTNLTYLPMHRFAQILYSIQKYFPIHWLIHIFFTCGIGPDILMNMLQDYIVFLIWAA